MVVIKRLLFQIRPLSMYVYMYAILTGKVQRWYQVKIKPKQKLEVITPPPPSSAFLKSKYAIMWETTTRRSPQKKSSHFFVNLSPGMKRSSLMEPKAFNLVAVNSNNAEQNEERVKRWLTFWHWLTVVGLIVWLVLVLHRCVVLKTLLRVKRFGPCFPWNYRDYMSLMVWSRQLAMIALVGK